jgi:hypothetical protein
MGFMSRRPLLLFSLFVAVFGLAIGSFAALGQESQSRGRKYKAPPPTSRVEVTVLRDVNGKPIENAAVIFHLMGDKGNMELKTNEDGKAVIDVLPTGGEVRLQVIARGFQTYGDDFKIDLPSMGLEIKMKRPGEQYSIYKAHNNDPLQVPARATVPAAAGQPDQK